MLRQKVSMVNLGGQKINFSESLSQYSKSFLPADATEITITNIEPLSKQGVSSKMYFFSLSYNLKNSVERKDLVLRVYNRGFEADGRKEYLMLKALKEENLAVPYPYCYEPDTSILGHVFMIMEKINGEPVTFFLEDETSAFSMVNNMAKVLCELHKLDVSCIRNYRLLKRQYELDQEQLLRDTLLVKETPGLLFKFANPYQRRFISLLKNIDNLKSRGFSPAILHNDFEPNHVIVANKQYFIIDWHRAVIGDPAYDVAWAYHELRLAKKPNKFDLGEYFVECYEKYADNRLVNLQFCKKLAALRIASWFLLFPFSNNVHSHFPRFFELAFGNTLGVVGYNLRKHRLQNTMQFQHSVGLKNVEYFQNYVVDYLEKSETSY